MRPAIGLIAILLLVIGGVLLVFDLGDGQQIGGPCLRVGILMSLVWMSEPQLRRLPRWLPIAVIALAVVLALRPKLFLVSLVIVVALWLLRPRGGRSRQ
jgi:hypothetical protein